MNSHYIFTLSICPLISPLLPLLPLSSSFKPPSSTTVYSQLQMPPSTITAMLGESPPCWTNRSPVPLWLWRRAITTAASCFQESTWLHIFHYILSRVWENISEQLFPYWTVALGPLLWLDTYKSQPPPPTLSLVVKVCSCILNSVEQCSNQKRETPSSTLSPQSMNK